MDSAPMGTKSVDCARSADVTVESEIWSGLAEVYDPEIPTLSVLDLGMVHNVNCMEGRVQIQITPTFVGCPALALIRKNVENRIARVPGVLSVAVEFVFDEAWTTDKISDDGKRKLREFGIAPPACSLLQMQSLHADCPYCGASNTRMENLFGPTACRSMFYCKECRQPFEAMKPV